MEIKAELFHYTGAPFLFCLALALVHNLRINLGGSYVGVSEKFGDCVEVCTISESGEST